MCTNCLTKNPAPDCCDKHFPQEIDNDIIDIVIKLNQKGYKTCACCSGHIIPTGTIKFITTCIYILFAENYKFPVIPKSFKYHKMHNNPKVYGNLWLNINTSKITEERQGELIAKKMQELNSWVEKL